MAGRRVLVSGMGGELGSLVASLLETEPWTGEILGLDIDPPRRRLRRATFHRVAPTDRARTIELVTAFDPHVVVHVGVYEPDARANPADASRWTRAAADHVLGAAAEVPSLAGIVVRSGLEVYGRDRSRVTRPDATTPIAPSSRFGRDLAAAETTAAQVGALRDVPVACVRLASVIGPHVPSPLGRLLRLPAVPFDALRDAAFTVIDDRDAARALVAAARVGADGPLNVAAPGATTASRAARRGGRLPIPVAGPPWLVVRAAARALGAPIPDHVGELLVHGRLVDAGAAHAVLGVEPTWSTPQVIDALYAWEPVQHVRVHDPGAVRTVA